ncbi:hypothetical protein P4O66_021412, partial [Electrophorus voltai]
MVARPLTVLLRGTAKKLRWGPEVERSFLELKEAFSTTLVLQQLEPEKPFVLEVDASDIEAQDFHVSALKPVVEGPLAEGESSSSALPLPLEIEGGPAYTVRALAMASRSSISWTGNGMDLRSAAGYWPPKCWTTTAPPPFIGNMLRSLSLSGWVGHTP